MDRRVEQVHVTAAAVAQAGLATEDLRSHPVQVHAVRDREVVRPVGRGDRVVRAQVGAHARRHRLLAGGKVHLPRYESLADVEAGPLVGVVLAQDRLLEGSREDHGPVQPEPGRGVERGDSWPVGCGGGHALPPDTNCLESPCHWFSEADGGLSGHVMETA